MLYVIRFVGKDGHPDEYRQDTYGTTPYLQDAETTSSERSAMGKLRHSEGLIKSEYMVYCDRFVRAELVPVKLVLLED